MEKAAYTIREAANILGISRNSAYEAVRRGDLPALRFGRSIRIPKIAIEKILDQSSGSTYD